MFPVNLAFRQSIISRWWKVFFELVIGHPLSSIHYLPKNETENALSREVADFYQGVLCFQKSYIFIVHAKYYFIYAKKGMTFPAPIFTYRTFSQYISVKTSYIEFYPNRKSVKNKRKFSFTFLHIDICMSKGYFIIVWRCAPSRQIVTSELVPLLLALTLEHVT
jgi:hypothetical protein